MKIQCIQSYIVSMHSKDTVFQRALHSSLSLSLSLSLFKKLGYSEKNFSNISMKTCCEYPLERPHQSITYHTQPHYHTYSYKRTVKQFRSLQITASILFVYFFITALCNGHPFELHRLVDAIQMSTHNICFYKENQKKNQITTIK